MICLAKGHSKMTSPGEGGRYPKVVTKSEVGRGVHANSDITTEKNYV